MVRRVEMLRLRGWDGMGWDHGGGPPQIKRGAGGERDHNLDERNYNTVRLV